MSHVLSSQQNIALAKYHNIWATYHAKYDSMHKVQELKQVQEEIQLLSQKSKNMQLIVLMYTVNSPIVAA